MEGVGEEEQDRKDEHDPPQVLWKELVELVSLVLQHGGHYRCVDLSGNNLPDPVPLPPPGRPWAAHVGPADPNSAGVGWSQVHREPSEREAERQERTRNSQMIEH